MKGSYGRCRKRNKKRKLPYTYIYNWTHRSQVTQARAAIFLIVRTYPKASKRSKRIKCGTKPTDAVEIPFASVWDRRRGGAIFTRGQCEPIIAGLPFPKPRAPATKKPSWSENNYALKAAGELARGQLTKARHVDAQLPDVYTNDKSGRLWLGTREERVCARFKRMPVVSYLREQRNAAERL